MNRDTQITTGDMPVQIQESRSVTDRNSARQPTDPSAEQSIDRDQVSNEYVMAERLSEAEPRLSNRNDNQLDKQQLEILFNTYQKSSYDNGFAHLADESKHTQFLNERPESSIQKQDMLHEDQDSSRDKEDLYKH